jgi:two-component system OmpR family response regulator
MRLLIVEDEPNLRENLTKGLTQAGYLIDACGTGDEADAMLLTETYDLIVLDINLPGPVSDTVMRCSFSDCRQVTAMALSGVV